MFINLDDYVMIENKVKQGTVLENIHGELFTYMITSNFDSCLVRHEKNIAIIMERLPTVTTVEEINNEMPIFPNSPFYIKTPHKIEPGIKNGDRIAIHENEECTHPFTYTVVYDRYNSCYSLMDPTWEIVLKTYDSINGLSRDQLRQYSKCLFGDDAIIKIEPVQWVSNS